MSAGGSRIKWCTFSLEFFISTRHLTRSRAVIDPMGGVIVSTIVASYVGWR